MTITIHVYIGAFLHAVVKDVDPHADSDWLQRMYGGAPFTWRIRPC